VTWSTAFGEGLPRGEFVPFYEKQADTDTGEITGFEMLGAAGFPRRERYQPGHLHSGGRGYRPDRRAFGNPDQRLRWKTRRTGMLG